MKQALYFECATGISGDMTVAALLDLGADEAALRRTLDSLRLDGVEVKISRVKKAGLDVCDFDVILPEENHDHDMEYLYGHEHPHDHEHEHEHHHDHEHEYEHHHDHDHEHGHDHHHAHRGLTEILSILQQADMTPGARTIAEKTFRILADAEAKAHGVALEDVHFHEVGAADSIVDVAAAAVCLDSLGVTDCVFPALCEGSGSVRCQHGVLPVPVPAVANIVQAHGLPLTITPQRGELVTPTGAAIAAAVCTATRLPERFRILKTGMGAGKREYERPSILRVMLIETDDGAETSEADASAETLKVDASAAPESDTLTLLETNVDDCTGEALGYVMEAALQAGARDVFYTPIYMKKNRPAYLLSVLCTEADRTALERLIFTNTTTIGIRRSTVRRTTLARRSGKVKTSLGEIDVKVYHAPDGNRVTPEYESVAAICRSSGKSWQTVMKVLRAELSGVGQKGSSATQAESEMIRRKLEAEFSDAL
ncbi:MAG: nickel pincer cofactor biosynthesis protein LarC [Oscillibacter sp.]|nr:nickel pincer cofactor biosynthesis protein LarC [Oscillibacter sp.]